MSNWEGTNVRKNKVQVCPGATGFQDWKEPAIKSNPLVSPNGRVSRGGSCLFSWLGRGCRDGCQYGSELWLPLSCYQALAVLSALSEAQQQLCWSELFLYNKAHPMWQ